MTFKDSQPGGGARRPLLLFDQQDLELVETVDELTAVGGAKHPKRVRKLLSTHLHPRGIKELAATRPQRIAYAVIRLLDSLDRGLVHDRLSALAALREEIVGGGDSINAGRVLVEKMKQLVRERDQFWTRVECAHDFFAAVSARPAAVRRQLTECHLLEMSEKWNQVAFDHHVHDAHTKGRKAPTHLVVDAWIKGIREMTVIYYCCTTAEVLTELLEAANLMGVTVQPGIEVAGLHRGKYAQIIWCPSGLATAAEYVHFIGKPKLRFLFEEGAEIIRYQTERILELLDSFNEHHLPGIAAELELELMPLGRQAFLDFVGVGQPAKSHLAEFIHAHIIECARAELPALRAQWASGRAAERKRIEARLAPIEALTPDQIAKNHLAWAANPTVENPNVPQDGAHVLPQLRRTCAEVTAALGEVRSGSAFTLNPSNLSPADVLEILYDARGAITHIEIFNLKDHQHQKSPRMRAIADLRHTLNSGNPIACKRMVQQIMREVEQGEEPAEAKHDRLAKLREVLANLQVLIGHYAKTPLGSRTGTDSIGRGRARAGMGLAVLSTLPRRTVSEFRRHPGTREVIPVQTQAVLQTTWMPRESGLPLLDLAQRALRRIPGLGVLGYDRGESYVVLPNTTVIAEPGNIVTLGGTPTAPTRELPLEEAPAVSPKYRLRYLNTNTKNALKIIVGLVPAFLTFLLTKQWWVIAYLGAFIWFGITGLRNVIQSVLGGGGIFRSDALRWKDLVSWSRIADSLLFTGFSVPLLDWLVKSLLLERALGITTATAPLALYSVMAIANGTYLFSHNVFRGLPRSAAWGNFFRSVLSIPIAFGLNALLLRLLQAYGLELGAANVALQTWAAVIGKLASDTVAGFIEGTADRALNIQRRQKDYQTKIARLLELHGKLEVHFPDIDVVDLLATPKRFRRKIGKEAQELVAQQMVNALDLMYFWTFQPRARVVFRSIVAAANAEERRIILLSQRLLERDRRISSMFLDDLVGRTYDRALAFYLGKREAYLRDMRALAGKHGVDWSGKDGDDDPVDSSAADSAQE